MVFTIILLSVCIPLLLGVLPDFIEKYQNGKKYDELSSQYFALKDTVKENNAKFAFIIDKYEQVLMQKNDELEQLKNSSSSYVYQKIFKIVEKELEDFDNLIVHFKCKDRPAYSSAQKVQEAKNKAKDFEIKYKLMKYEYDTLFELFPELENYIEYGSGEENLQQIQEYFDKVSNWLTKEEYDRLSESERNQLALDRYVQSYSKSKWQIGRDFEMAMAHYYTQKGYFVQYTGIEEKLNDKGRDIIAENGKEILIVQCKYWSKEKIIHEKHLCQLYGTTIQYKRKLKTKKRIKPVFITSTLLSDSAREFAKDLKIKVLENQEFIEFPRIKCNISKNNEKIYHLPFDQQYDNTKIEPEKGEMFAFSVKEAEQKGFRRAKKWIWG
ncbi:MAG: restriction endonuclease [Cyanobacteria bacterium SIG26]|nr:restriction endonuclease [Cyanobacteria bacterium SIG26]